MAIKLCSISKFDDYHALPTPHPQYSLISSSKLEGLKFPPSVEVLKSGLRPHASWSLCTLRGFACRQCQGLWVDSAKGGVHVTSAVLSRSH